MGITARGRFRAALFSFLCVLLLWKIVVLDSFCMVSILSHKGRFKQSLILINFITVLHVTVNEAFIAKLNVR